MRARGGAVLGVVLAVDDAGEAQTITVQTHDGIVRSGVEVMSIHGLASHPGAGATAVLLAIEGDQGHYVALPLSLFGWRFGAQGPGSAALYDDAGNRIVFPGDGTCTLTTAALMRVVARSLLVQTQAGAVFRGPVTFDDDVLFRGNVEVVGNIAAGGNITAGGSITPGVPLLSPPADDPGFV